MSPIYAAIGALLLMTSHPSRAINRDMDLLPFGPQNGDTRMENGDDVSTREIQLETPISFYDDYFTSLYVNLNGAITFDTDLRDYQSNLALPFGVKAIVPFFADVDTRMSGNVFYRETGDPTLKDKITEYIRQNFADQDRFYPETLFIATWEDVGHFNRKYDHTNTFQVVIASDGRDSFVLFLYPEDGLTWVRGEGKSGSVRPDTAARAGFDANDDSRFFELPGSGTAQVDQLSARSNINEPGLWLFRVGELGGANVEEPAFEDDGRSPDQELPEENETHNTWEGEEESEPAAGPDQEVVSCERGGDSACHASAQCTDYPSAGGFCCECVAPFVGNGKECIRSDEAQRISGKVSGRVNGVAIDAVDLHAYVVTTDGRTYTAVSRIPGPIGYSLQGLYVIGSVLGFLFALPQQQGARNGFMITGGQFNRTAVIQFASTGESLTMRQTFHGQDAQGHLQMSTTLEGRLPDIDPETKVEVDDYQEDYRRVSPGVLKSLTTHFVRADSEQYRFTLDQTINYSECQYRPLTDVDIIRIDVTRNFLVYTATEQIVRFSQTNKVVSASGVVDPCRDARCNPNSDCVPQGDSYQCVCRAGYEGQWCQDIDECSQDAGACDVNAECYNTQGSYQCRCYAGFSGDGRYCRQESETETGTETETETEGCEVLRNCDPYARCEYDEQIARYTCKCSDGYSGDGYECTMDTDTESDCNLVSTMCDVNAQCDYDSSTQTHRCRCIRGWEGNGYTCNRIDCRRDPTICDLNARCERQHIEYTCTCKQGYQGDGFECLGSSPPQLTNSLIYTQGMYISSVPFNPSDSNPGRQTLYIPGQTAIGIDVDCYSHYFYWTDVSGRTISRAKLDGTDSEVFLRNLGSPEGVAVDWLSKNVYWTDSIHKRIEVVRFDGTSRKTLISDQLVNPRAVVVDPIRGVVFWSDWNRASPKIEKANMDGSERRTVVSDGLGLPNGLTIDYDAMQICWADAGTHKVECVGYDGRGRRTLNQSAGYPFGLAFANDNLYWTDWDRQTLPNINKLLSQTPNEDLTLPSGANGRLYGIAAVRTSCPSGSNSCALNNGGCRFLCLPSANGGRTCTCPDDIEAEECNRISTL